MYRKPHNHNWKERTDYVIVRKYSSAFGPYPGYYYNAKELRTFDQCIKCPQKRNIQKN